MKFGVVSFPGSNCDHDMIYLFEEVLQKETIPLWHKDTDLKGFSQGDAIILPGGFSYGDYLRCGAIARFAPIMKAISAFAAAGGFVYGICNGFQILCESGLLPGVLLPNTQQKYRCMNVFLKTETTNSMLTNQLEKGQVLQIPIAHADGRYFADHETLVTLKENDQIIFRYCSESGETGSDYNPNGALENIAGICNKERNVYGMMPHPERASELIHGNTDGLHLFKSLLHSLELLHTETPVSA
jgi:phosphoribosylformylglycinamidine synthase subunit PurQ / glutaminase